MPVVKYRIQQSKRIQVSSEYFLTDGENMTTTVIASFPDDYSVVNGWTHYIVFKVTTPITLTDGAVVTVYKAELVSDQYVIPSALIMADISHIQFQAERLVDAAVYRFESENKLFPRTGTSITGVEGMALPLPSFYITETTMNALLDDRFTIFTGEADLKYALRAELEGLILGQISDGSLTDLKLSNTSGQIKERVATHIASTANPHAVTAEQASAIPETARGASNGVATLGSDGKHTASQVPSAILAPGDVIAHNVVGGGTTSLTYVLVASAYINCGGALRVSFELRTTNSNATAYARIYKNGSPIGIERSTTSQTNVTFTEDISGFIPGDLIGFYTKISNNLYNSNVSYIKFKVASITSFTTVV